MKEHGGNVTQAARKYGFAKEEIVDFSANINFLGPPQSVLEVIKSNLAAISDYPDSNYYQFKASLAKLNNCKLNNLIVANGAVELIYLIAKALNPERSLVLAPTFSEYRKATEAAGGQVLEYQLQQENNFDVELEKLLPKLTEIDLFFLCNPNNPTGSLLSKDQVEKVIGYAAENDTFVVVDEAFIDFLDKEVSVIDLVSDYDNLFILRSLTKFFAIPGLRLGYGVGNQDLITKLNKYKDPWNVNYLAQLAGQVALDDKEYIRQTKEAIARERDFLTASLAQIKKIKIYPPTANYILSNISRLDLTASQLEKELAQQGILIRNCSNFSNLDDNFIRLAVKRRSNNKQLIAKLQELIIQN